MSTLTDMLDTAMTVLPTHGYAVAMIRENTKHYEYIFFGDFLNKAYFK